MVIGGYHLSEGLSAVVFLDCAAAASEVDGRRIILKFKRYPGTWIYCNYPERLPAAALGDSGLGNKYLNRVFVEGEAQLFASYLNTTGGDLFFGVLIHNAGNATATVVRQAVGHRHSGKYPDWCDVQGGVWGDFFNSSSEEIFAVHSRESVWIFEGPAPTNKFFNTVLALQTDMLLECFVYIYRNRANVDGTATCFPWTRDPSSTGELETPTPWRPIWDCISTTCPAIITPAGAATILTR